LLDILHLSHMYAPKAKAISPTSSSSSMPAYAAALSEGSTAEEPFRQRLSQVSGANRVEEASNFACQPPCIAHEVFGMEYLDLPRCTFCAATGEPTVVSSFLYRVYVAELLAVQGRADAAVDREAGGDVGPTVSDQVSRIAARWTGNRPEMQDGLRSLCQRSVDKKCTECNSPTPCCQRDG